MSPISNRHRKSFNELGHAHELTFSCYHRYQFFSRDRFCQWLVESINKARESQGFSIWAYVFMPNHVHLKLHFGRKEYEIAKTLREIKLPVSRKALAFLRQEAPHWLPKLEQKRGERLEYHFWQRGGGYDRNITDPATLEKMIDYIHLNPVRKGFVERASDWKWSSAGAFIGETSQILKPDPIPPEWTVGMSQ